MGLISVCTHTGHTGTYLWCLRDDINCKMAINIDLNYCIMKGREKGWSGIRMGWIYKKWWQEYWNTNGRSRYYRIKESKERVWGLRYDANCLPESLNLSVNQTVRHPEILNIHVLLLQHTCVTVTIYTCYCYNIHVLL
jgi:hypothetical protein